MDHFEFDAGREFWPEAGGIRILRERGDRALLATFSGGCIRIGETDWSGPNPTGKLIKTPADLQSWLA